MLEKNSNRNSFSRLPDRSCDGRHCIIPRAACRLLKPWGKPIFKNNSCHLSTLSAESQVIDKDSTGCGESRYARGRVLLIWNHFENSVTCFFVNALWQQTFKPLLTNVFEINKPLVFPRENHDVFRVHASPVLSRCKQSFVRCWKRKKNNCLCLSSPSLMESQYQDRHPLEAKTRERANKEVIPLLVSQVNLAFLCLCLQIQHVERVAI